MFRFVKSQSIKTGLLFRDLYKMMDVNDFGRFVSKNLSKRFIALSGVVTIFTIIGQYTERIVYGRTPDSGLTENFLDALVANFVIFGIPGTALLLLTHLFSFFNRANYFTAQANYMNLLETYKRTPAQLEKIVDKLWSYVYRREFNVLKNGASHAGMCAKVLEIERRKLNEISRLFSDESIKEGEAGEAPAREPGLSPAEPGAGPARRKYETVLQRAESERFLRNLPWEHVSLREKCSGLDQVVNEEIVEEITARDLFLCETGFKFNATWFLSNSMQLNMKHRKTGIDLKLVDDWLDGAFFDVTDAKLIEQYIAEATLKSVKIQARVPAVPFILRQGWRTMLQRIWTSMVFRITAKRIGRFLQHLNHRYVRDESDRFDRDYFKAEAFFWRSKAYEAEIREEIGEKALERLRKLRKKWLMLTIEKIRLPKGRKRPDEAEMPAVLEKTLKGARRLIRRMFSASVYNIHELRLHFDPDYAILVADRDSLEFERMEIDTDYVTGHRTLMQRKRDDAMEFLRFFRMILSPDEMRDQGAGFPVDEETMRAVRVVCHINEGELRKLARREMSHGFDPRTRAGIYEVVADIAKRKRSYSRKIRQLGTFQTLAIHHVKMYIRNIGDMYRKIIEGGTNI